jgi:hypothetical protein
MRRRHVLAALAVAALTALAGRQAPAAGGDHSEHFDKSSRICGSCAVECHRCAQHCSKLAAGGKKEFDELRHLCAACGDMCSVCSRQSAWERPGAVTSVLCEASAKLCEMCEAACAKYPDDKKLAACAKECKACATHCRDMVKLLGGGK